MNKVNFWEAPDFKKLRLLFLDVDGVLNSRKTVVFSKRWPDSYDELSYEFAHENKHIRYAEAFDKYAIQLVNRLCEATETFIVISSSWRTCYTELEDVKNMFQEIGISKDLIIGRTIDHYYGEFNRGKQIANFLSTLAKSKEARNEMCHNSLLDYRFFDVDAIDVDSFVILDDLDGEALLKSQETRIVKTDDYDGLTLRDTLKAGVILTYDIAFGVKDLQSKDCGFKFK